MSIHGVENRQNFITPVKQTSKAAGPVETNSFSDLIAGSRSPSVANPLEPAKTTIGTAAAAPATGFAALFSNYVPAITPSSTAAPFTAAFEEGAYVTKPDGSKTSLNPAELATPTTAQEVATLLGGTVTSDSLSGNFTSSVPTAEISVPGSNVEVNAGLAASLFATYGTAQGSQAWITINSDLGLSPMSTGAVT